MTGSLGKRLARGAASGLAGTAVLACVEQLERALLGHRPVFAPSRIAARLSQSTAVLSEGRARARGRLMRWTYGPTLGASFALVRRRLPPSPALSGLVFGIGVAGFELTALPAVSATPPVRSWGRREIALLALQTAVYGLATAFALDRITSA